MASVAGRAVLDVSRRFAGTGGMAAKALATSVAGGSWAAKVGGVPGSAAIVWGDVSKRSFSDAPYFKEISDGLMRAIAKWDLPTNPVAVFHGCGDFRLMRAKLSLAARLREQGWKVPFAEATPGARIARDHEEDLGFAGMAFKPKYVFVFDHKDCGRGKKRPDSKEHPLDMGKEVHTEHKEGYLHEIDKTGVSYDGDTCIVEHGVKDNRQTLIDAGFTPISLVVDLENNEFLVFSPTKGDYYHADDIIEKVERDRINPLKEYGIPPVALAATQGKILSLSEAGARIDAVDEAEREMAERRAEEAACGRV